MSYVKHEFKSGQKLYAAQLNEMDEQIRANEQAIEEKSGADAEAIRALGERVAASEQAISEKADAEALEAIGERVAASEQAISEKADAGDVDTLRQAADIAAEALARGTLSGTRLVIGDAIAGRVMRCACEGPVTVRSLNRVALGDISFTGQYKVVKFSEPIPAGTYRFSARVESTDTDSEQALALFSGSNFFRINHDGQRHSATFKITGEVSQITLYSGANAVQSTGDTAYWRDIMITDGTDDYPYEPGMETALYENPAQVTLHEITNIVEADTEISLTYARRNEWLDSILSATKSAELNAQTLGYVTPEMFGAVGDGVTDDLEAVQAALVCAREMGLPVRATRRYLVSGGITIESGMDVDINSLSCTGSGNAVNVYGSYSHIRIRELKAAGSGIALIGENNIVAYNEINLVNVQAGRDCIVMSTIDRAVVSNQVQFMRLSAGGDGCCCIRRLYDEIGSCITENSFTGGLCTNADWAYYGGGGNSKLYNFQVESQIKGGFFITGGVCYIIGARYAESQRDGEYPYLKIYSPSELPNTDAGAVTAIRFIGADILKVNEIDVSEVTTDVYQASNPENKSKLASSASIGHIDCRICGYGITGQNGFTIYQHLAEGALVWGNCLIFQGVPRKRYRVTESLDLRTIGPDTPGLPTVFDIACAGAEIHLHPTYCFMGLARFEVIQTDAYTATIYDYYTGGVIFDGASLGAGEFEVETYLDPDYTRAYIDGEGMAWRIRRLDGTGSTPVTPVVPETPEQEAQLSVDDSGDATLSGAALSVDSDGNATISGAALSVDGDGNATIA